MAGDPTGSAFLEGKVAWVTGASRGLGRSAAIALANAGVRVAVTARSRAALDGVMQAIGDQSRVLAVPASVTDSEAIRHAAERVEEWGPIDILVTMAGISPLVHESAEVSDADWNEILSINLSGTFYCCREAAKFMLSRRAGSIITVSSVHGSVGARRMAAYAASKGGVEALSRSLALEWADRGVRVNCLAPGYFQTDMTKGYLSSRHGSLVREGIPLNRIGDPAEINSAILFLAGAGSSYATGTILYIDGGWTAQ